MISDASPLHMARDLVARHSDIGFIRGYIFNYFGRAPTREKIEALRADHLAREAYHSRARSSESDLKRKQRESRRMMERNAAKRYRARRAA